jgi:2-polyprenyl-3-methyl-5-hydroxy-6-metoxy-1,4-benzoquinol methylase
MIRATSAPPIGEAWAPQQRHIAIELESVGCLLCGGQDHETLVASGDHLTRIGGKFQVVKCRRCQLAYTNPRPAEQSIGLFYPDGYSPYSGHEPDPRAKRTLRRRLEHAVLRTDFGYPPKPTGLITAAMALSARAIIRRTRPRDSWIPFRPPGRMLDFGCGAGDFMKRMRSHGWTVEGMDFSPTVAQMLSQSAGFRVHIGTLPHADIKPESFDAITMWHSLEHVHSPRGVLQSASQVLRAGGLLVVGVPNLASWSFRRFGQNWYALELPRHLTHFTPETLSAMVETEGFKVQSLSQVGRESCVRKSARRASQSGGDLRWLRALQFPQFSRLVAQWTERSGQADCIRMIAEKQ